MARRRNYKRDRAGRFSRVQGAPGKKVQRRLNKYGAERSTANPVQISNRNRRTARRAVAIGAAALAGVAIASVHEGRKVQAGRQKSTIAFDNTPYQKSMNYEMPRSINRAVDLHAKRLENFSPMVSKMFAAEFARKTIWD